MFLRLHPSTTFWNLVDYEGYSLFSRGFLPTIADIMSSELNLPILIHFCSFIAKMLMSSLAIPCLTTSSLPCFMDLTFQIPMQYCSSQHQTSLSQNPQLSVISALAQLLHSFYSYCPLLFPSSILDTFQPGGLIFWCHFFLPFCAVHSALTARISSSYASPFATRL